MIRQQELRHVQILCVRRIFLDLSEVGVKTLNVEHKDFGELHEHVAHFGLCLAPTGLVLARVEVVEGVLCTVVLKALDEGALVLKRLRHEWIKRD